MKGIWFDQGRSEADWLDAMDRPGGDDLRRHAGRHDQEADRLDGEL